MICTGMIPSPHLPKDLNSFLQPLIDKLVKLAQGVEAVDVVNEEVFALCAHILAVFGDLPAMAKLMEFVGHNGRFPCCLCKIMSILGWTAKNGTHLYCPLHRLDNTGLDPHNLPLQTHQQCLDEGYSVLQAPSDTAHAELATKCGIKGVTLLAQLLSVWIPDLFPVKAMHLLLINLIPQLADLWRKRFNGIDSGFENYVIDSILWDLVGDKCVKSTSTTPTSFGCPVPHFKNQSHFIAESWSCWALHLAPSLLRCRFMDSRYYLQSIRNGFIKWVQDFEEIYYQHDPNRLQVCTTNVHYLLHIADSIERLGPLPAQLCIICKIYGLRKEISFGQTQAETEDDLEKEKQIADRFQDYNNQLLLTPQAERLTVTPELRSQIAKYLATTYGVRGRMRIKDGGNLIQARGYHKLWWDGRNASFVQYELAIDRLAHRPRATPEFEVKSFYGQLQRLFYLPLPPNTIINREEYPKFLILAFILEANVTIEDTYEYQVIWYEGKLGSGEVVDARTIQCAVGRIPDVIIFDERRVYVILLSRYSYKYICHSLIGVRRAFIGPSLTDGSRLGSRPLPTPTEIPEPRKIRPTEIFRPLEDDKDPTPGKVRPLGQKSDPGRLQESDPQVKVRSLSKIRPPRRPQGSDPQAKSDPRAEIRPRRTTEIRPSNGNPTPARVRPQKKTRIRTPPGTGLSHPHPDRAYLPPVGFWVHGVVNDFPSLRYLPKWFPGAQFQRIGKVGHDMRIRYANETFNMVFDQLRRGQIERSSYVSGLLESKGGENASEEDIYLIKWTAASLFTAGSTTTASLVNSFFLVVSLYPECAKKAQAEIDSVVGRDRIPTLQDRGLLSYTDALVQEVMRMCPPVPLGLAHLSTEDIEFHGYRIPKGTTINPNIWQADSFQAQGL
ncbi:Transposase family tnp2, partial [Rhizoctonia solani]